MKTAASYQFLILVLFLSSCTKATPIQGRWISGVITHYNLFGSKNGRNWSTLSEGEFSNIIANPIEQNVLFSKPNSV